MSEKTTIGGVVYESIGSSTSNLLLKCNGTARIQWGHKLIDLIKNGKVVSNNSSEQIFLISDEDQIASDGIYILDKNQSNKLFICKDGNKYDFAGTDLYISANTKQSITDEQRTQALENIGLYYNTLNDVYDAGIKNGIVYILDENKLYTIKDGVVEEFQARIKSVTVEQEQEQQYGDVINSSTKIVLSIANSEYLVLANKRITANYPIYINNSAQIGSENASSTQGYRLYMDKGVSYLDVDKINVRHGLDIVENIEITFQDFWNSMKAGILQPEQWYVITDFQNHWKLTSDNAKFNRPLLVKALSNNSLYKEGFLFNNRSIKIQYDPEYQELISQSYVTEDLTKGTRSVNARGRIIWMQDNNNNEANFDFLDYTNAKGIPLAPLYDVENFTDKSIFPTGSYNNKLIVQDLWGTVINEEDKILTEINGGDVTTKIAFNSEELFMHDNVIHCRGFRINSSCKEFYGNTFYNAINTEINCNLFNSNFKYLQNCIFNSGTIENVICNSNISDYTFSESNDILLYNSPKHKQVYFENNTLQVFYDKEHYFHRGMIMMYSGLSEIPDGWAICDGSTHTYNGITTTTPNLVGRFIKATDDVAGVGPVDIHADNKITISEHNLPEHKHPHNAHSHIISEFTGSVRESGDLTSALEFTDYVYDVRANKATVVSNVANNEVITTDVISSISTYQQGGDAVGGNHTHTLSISGGSVSSETSTEQTKTWENKAIQIEPNYYALIFIMKL